MLIEFRRELDAHTPADGNFRPLEVFEQNEKLLEFISNNIIYRKLVIETHSSYNRKFPMYRYLIKNTRQRNKDLNQCEGGGKVLFCH